MYVCPLRTNWRQFKSFEPLDSKSLAITFRAIGKISLPPKAKKFALGHAMQEQNPYRTNSLGSIGLVISIQFLVFILKALLSFKFGKIEVNNSNTDTNHSQTLLFTLSLSQRRANVTKPILEVSWCFRPNFKTHVKRETKTICRTLFIPVFASLSFWEVGAVSSTVPSFFSSKGSAGSLPFGDIKGLDDDRLRSGGGGVGGHSSTARSLSVPPSNFITTTKKMPKLL